MRKEFYIGRNNFALTVFIPVDCKNNCPFCTSKKDYATCGSNLAEVTKSIIKIGKAGMRFHDVVITGGEPFADLTVLSDLIKIIKNNISYLNLFINTSMPKSSAEKAISFINRSPDITGVNVSRHISIKFPDLVADDEQLKAIIKTVRINCVLTGNESDEDIVDFYHRFNSIGDINYRADYRTITQENLHSMSYPLFVRLDNLFGFKSHGQCNVCHTDRFGTGVILHRGIEHSSIEFASRIEVNDFIIKQNGEIRYDWDANSIATDETISDLSKDSVRLYGQMMQQMDDDKSHIVKKKNSKKSLSSVLAKWQSETIDSEEDDIFTQYRSPYGNFTGYSTGPSCGGGCGYGGYYGPCGGGGGCGGYSHC